MILVFGKNDFCIFILYYRSISFITQGSIFEILPYISTAVFSKIKADMTCVQNHEISWLQFLLLPQFKTIINHAILSSSLWHGFSLHIFCWFCEHVWMLSFISDSLFYCECSFQSPQKYLLFVLNVLASLK